MEICYLSSLMGFNLQDIEMETTENGIIRTWFNTKSNCITLCSTLCTTAQTVSFLNKKQMILLIFVIWTWILQLICDSDIQIIGLQLFLFWWRNSREETVCMKYEKTFKTLSVLLMRPEMDYEQWIKIYSNI